MPRSPSILGDLSVQFIHTISELRNYFYILLGKIFLFTHVRDEIKKKNFRVRSFPVLTCVPRLLFLFYQNFPFALTKALNLTAGSIVKELISRGFSVLSK